MKNIASALVKAQKAFGPALKTSTNPHFKSKYADLAACVEAVIESLNSNGIYLMQASHECADGVLIETVMIHESGEQISAGRLHVPAQKQDPQGYGSALTYARRYSLMAACGIAPEDDDGNAGSRPKNTDGAPQSKLGVDSSGRSTKLADKTLVMKIRTKIQEHIVAGRDLGALQEYQTTWELGDEVTQGVWAGLTTPEQNTLRKLLGEAQ